MRLRQVLPLFLAAQDGGVNGMARMHALVKIAQARLSLEDRYSFEPQRGGLVSKGLDDDLEELVRRRLVEKTGNDAVRFSATREGVEVVRRFVKDKSLAVHGVADAFEATSQVHRTFSATPLTELADTAV